MTVIVKIWSPKSGTMTASEHLLREDLEKALWLFAKALSCKNTAKRYAKTKDGNILFRIYHFENKYGGKLFFTSLVKEGFIAETSGEYE